MQLVDTHVHLNFADFQADLEDIARRWRQAEVVHLVHSCVQPEEFISIQALVSCWPELACSVGLHPLEAAQWTTETGRQIACAVRSGQRVVAIGETGLDFYKADNTSEQMTAFWEQLAIAHDLGLPVIVHCREAAAATADLLHRFVARHGPIQGVMHCWGGSPAEAQWFLDLGFYLSFSGTVTFKNAKPIQATAQTVPAGRILVETDCPFLAPVPHRGQRNEPAHVRRVAQQVAELRGLDLETLATQTTLNARQLFRLAVPV
ncbi:MAG: TatD family hydrolase [Gloeomargaritaceae cyanobacterium C42_A2020_066]|nr:TatD family hydrolase [Gloeomargaritaceae cyanobacterium C42_A2020_066]